MSTQMTNHPVWMPFVGTGGALVATTGSSTSTWHDISGWTDKRISWVITGASTDADIIAHISPKGAYELNQITCTTADYEAINIKIGANSQIMASIDSDDIDELKHPIRSMRINISNDSGTAITAFSVWVEAWS